ncbi:acetate--CoA ligase family protein, partial [Devosia sp.]|uniref:acetate--CoA ligase family protein n=1 Tax=Devosia sp. TaxID=1871048 RepID=UPI002F23D0F0
KRPVVGVVTTTGGGAALVVDQLGVRAIAVEGPDEETLAKVRDTGVDVAESRIVDLTLAGARYEVMRGALDAMLASPRFDLVIAVVGSSARFQPELTVKPIIDGANGNSRLAVFLVPEAPDAHRMIEKAGVPCFRTPDSCADGVAAALRRRLPRQLQRAPATTGATHMLDEAEGYALLDEVGIPHAPALAVPVGTASVDTSYYPAAVKVLHREIAHKSDLGGIVLDVRSDADFQAAVKDIVANVGKTAPQHEIAHVLVQKMVRGAVGEALVGYRVDAQLGPVVVLATGGVATELYKDRCVRIAPVDLAMAHEMIDEVRGMALLMGFRGRPRGDIDALARTIVAVSQLAEHPKVAELEVNPVIVMPEGQGVLAVDVLAAVQRTIPA